MHLKSILLFSHFPPVIICNYPFCSGHFSLAFDPSHLSAHALLSLSLSSLSLSLLKGALLICNQSSSKSVVSPQTDMFSEDLN